MSKGNKRLELNMRFKEACIEGDEKIIEKLMAQKPCLDWGLEGACIAGNRALAERFVRSGAHIGWGLRGACLKNHSDLIELMLHFGANPRWGLSGACEGEHKDLAQRMLDAGGDPNWGIMGAGVSNSIQMRDMMRQAGANYEGFIRGLCKGGHFQEVQGFLEEYEGYIERLHEGGDSQKVQDISAGCAITKNDIYYSSKFIGMYAPKKLVHRYLSILNKQDEDIGRCIEGVIEFNSEEVIDSVLHLIKSHICYPATDSIYRSGRLWIFDKEFEKLDTDESMIMTAKCNGDQIDVVSQYRSISDYNRLLYGACINNNHELIELALVNGANPKYGLDGAAFVDNRYLVMLMLSKGADPNYGMLSAALHNISDIIELLIHYGAGPDVSGVATNCILRRSKESFSVLLKYTAVPQVYMQLLRSYNKVDWMYMVEAEIQRRQSLK